MLYITLNLCASWTAHSGTHLSRLIGVAGGVNSSSPTLKTAEEKTRCWWCVERLEVVAETIMIQNDLPDFTIKKQKQRKIKSVFKLEWGTFFSEQGFWSKSCALKFVTEKNLLLLSFFFFLHLLLDLVGNVSFFFPSSPRIKGWLLHCLKPCSRAQ